MYTFHLTSHHNPVMQLLPLFSFHRGGNLGKERLNNFLQDPQLIKWQSRGLDPSPPTILSSGQEFVLIHWQFTSYITIFPSFPDEKLWEATVFIDGSHYFQLSQCVLFKKIPWSIREKAIFKSFLLLSILKWQECLNTFLRPFFFYIRSI